MYFFVACFLLCDATAYSTTTTITIISRFPTSIYDCLCVMQTWDYATGLPFAWDNKDSTAGTGGG